MKNIGLSVVIPVYNEVENLICLLKEIQDNLECLKIDNEIIFINDFSKDNTSQLLKDLKFKYKNLEIINNNKNIGQSFSIIKGVQKSKFNTICTLDGDGQNNPRDIVELYKKYSKSDNIFLVSGYRNKRKDKFNKILASKIANWIRRIYLGDKCPDTGCSIKIFDKKIFLSFPFFNGLHRFISPIFELLHYEVVYMEVDHRPRFHGVSKYNNINRAFKGVRDMKFVKKEIKKILQIK